MPPLGPGLSEDQVSDFVSQWLREAHGLATYQRYNLDLSEPLPEAWKPAVIGVDLVAGIPGSPPEWIVEAMGDLNNAPHYQVHFSGTLYTLLTRTRPDDREKGRHLALALPYFPEGKVPSPYVPVLKRLTGTRFASGLEFDLLLVAPGPRVTHLEGENTADFLSSL
jgi:hypothetical protein